MPITNTALVQGVEEEGEKLPFDRLRVVSWAYPDLKQQVPPLSIIHPKPPHYHDSLSNDLYLRHDADSSGRHTERCRHEISEDEEDVVLDAEELNVDLLVGAKAAEEALKSYEIDVGFYCAEPDSPYRLDDQNLSKVITDDDLAVGKERWAHLVQNLTGGHISPHSRHDNGSQDLRSPASSEFLDLTDSEHSDNSVDSDPVPSTPKPRSYANVMVKQPSPIPLDFSPPRSLNASASSFIPTSTTPVKIPSVHFTSHFSRAVPSPSPSPTNLNFTFPSLNSSIQPLPSLPPTLKKDEQGFYTEVPLTPSRDQKTFSNRSRRSSSSLLPSFLADTSRRARRTSKTREIVDQLRSASVNDFNRSQTTSCVPVRPVSTPHQLTLVGPSLSIADEGACRWDSDASQSSISSRSAVKDFEEEGDGWLRADVDDGDGDPETKTRRTRHLVEALGRNRSDSTQGSDSDANQKDNDWELFTPPTHESKKSSKEASSTRRKGARHRIRKSHGGYRGSSAPSPTAPPPMSLSLNPLPPAQPFYPAYPVYTTPYTYPVSSYKPMQMPAQTHCFPAHAAYAGTPFGSIALYPPVIQLPPSASSMNMQGGFDRSGITGGTGIRHTQW